MTLTWYGQSCFKLDTREAVLAIDPFSKEIGLTPPRFRADIILITHAHYDHANSAAILARSPQETATPAGPALGGGETFVIAGPGEYEARGISIRGIPTFHDSHQGKERGLNTVYRIWAEGISMAHLGDFGEDKIRDETAEALGEIDVLLIPVGGTYTINGQAASAIIKQVEPRLVIPMHYHLPGLKVKLAPVDDFLKSCGVAKPEPLAKVVIKKKELPETETRFVVLGRE